MQRIGFVLKVNPDKIPEYKARHQAVWPEMLAALRRTGWRNYSLFLRQDGTLFGYLETPDTFEAALAGMARDVNARWQDFMAPLFAGAGDTQADQMMERLEQVFFLE